MVLIKSMMIQGDGYCNEDEWQEECVGFVDQYFKIIHVTFASVIIEKSEETCCTLSENGVCC